MARTNTNSGGTGGSGTVTQISTFGSIAGGPITTSGTISLVNDNATPGNSMYYGTNSSGTKGFFALPSAITTGNLTDAGTDGITITGGTGAVVGSGTSIAQHVADATHNGYLSSTDWVIFNTKPTLSQVLTAGNTATNQSITHLNSISDNSANVAITIGTRLLQNTASTTVFDWQQGFLYQPSLGIKVIDLAAGVINYLGTGVTAIDWQHSILNDEGLGTSIDWHNRALYATNGTTIAASWNNSNGEIKLNQYGVGTFTGTPAFNLAVDAIGNIIETNYLYSPTLQFHAYGGTTTSGGFSNAHWYYNSGSGATTILLSPSASVGNIFIVSDGLAIAATSNITLDAGAGHFIVYNDVVSQTFVMNQNGLTLTIEKITSSGNWKVIGVSLLGSSGGGTIGGTIATNQVGYGSGTNTLTSGSNFTFDPNSGSPIFSVGGLSSGNGNKIVLDDSNNTYNLFAAGTANHSTAEFTIYNFAQTGLFFDVNTANNPIVSMGDLSVLGNGTKLIIDDSSQDISADSRAGRFSGGDINSVGNGTQLIVDDSTGFVTINHAGALFMNAGFPQFQFGNINGTGRLVYSQWDTIGGGITEFVDSTWNVIDAATQSIISASIGGRNAEFGDIDGGGNNTKFRVDDGSQTYTFSKPNFDINSVPYVFPSSNAAGSLLNDGSGNLSWQPIVGVVASADLTGQTTSAGNDVILTFSPSATGTYRVGGYVNTLGTGAGTGSIRVDYTDENNTGQTKILTISLPTGVTAASWGFATGATNYVALDAQIRILAGTPVTFYLSDNVGGVTYDAGGTIEYMGH